MTTAAFIRSLRERLGLTQVALAQRLGISHITVNRWEKGRVAPNPASLQRLRELAGEPSRESSNAAASQPPRPDFLGDARAVRLLVEAERLSYGHLSNPAFAIETSRVDPLPHQRIAVYEHMLPQERLRFLLADDAGAGKTVMAGLYIREMLSRRLINRVLIIPPAGLIGNWARELKRFFGLDFSIVRGADLRDGNPFVGPGSARVICSLDTLAGQSMFTRLQAPNVEPYDLVVFDEAHKLSAQRETDLSIRKTDRYELAEALAGVTTDEPRWALDWSARHLLLLTATPHMGKDFPYYALWRLLEPDLLGSFEAFAEFPGEERRRHFIRRTKEEMVDLTGAPLYKPRHSDTLSFNLSQGPESEQELYERTTAYMRGFYNRAGILNQSAARLAQSVFQRRLASSTYAVCCSLERRLLRLDELIERVREGRLSENHIQAALRNLRDPFGDTADDDDDRDGVEAHEIDEERLLSLVRSTSLADLEAEHREVRDLLALARRVLDRNQDAKFEELRGALMNDRFRREKMIVFTEHRDTLTWLRRQLDALGFADRVAAIHGGLDFRQRELEVERFRAAAEDGGAQYLLATDAAGEGINLQFCALMVNYDIPWNPARLEQRMGRIHRYGQTREVYIRNLVATSTREGRVLATLLHKLDEIRQAMGSDKVFDVIGSVLEGVSMLDVMEEALTEAGTERAVRRVGAITRQQVEAVDAKRRALYGSEGDIAPELPRLRTAAEREALQRLLPGYVRQFLLEAGDVLGLRITGDVDGYFSVSGASAAATPLWEAIERYPPEAQTRLTVYRPPVTEPAIFMHPGEPVFERLRDIVRDHCRRDAMRGAVLVDPLAEAASVIFAVETSVIQGDGSSSRRTTAESLFRLIRVFGDGRVEPIPIERVLLMRPEHRFPAQHAGLAIRTAELRERAEEYVREHVLASLVAERRAALLATLRDREQAMVRGFDFQAAELAARRARLSPKAMQGNAAARQQLDRVKARQRELDARKQRAIETLRLEPDRLAGGPLTVMALALVSPATSEAARERFDADVEAAAVALARAWEEAAGATVRDVSTPPRARAAGLSDHPGFDLLATYPDGRRRAIEVKGRAGGGRIEVTSNEWARACNLRGAYWLYVVYDCATPQPRLVRVEDPFAALLVKARGGVLVNESDVVSAGLLGEPPAPVEDSLTDVVARLFWDHAAGDLRWPRDRELILARILQHGDEAAIRWLRQRLPDAEIATRLRATEGRGVDPPQLRLWQALLQLREDEVSRWVATARASAWEGRRA